MQINGPHPSIAPQRPLLRPAAGPGEAVPAAKTDPAASGSSGTTGSGTNGGTAAGGTQIVDASTIMANWGTSNPLADLNVDGIVDAQDLALVLEGSGGTASGDAAAWNAAAGGDLNGDGTIDAHDLALSLNGQGTATPADPWTTAAGGDLNGDGAVDAQDLALSLNGQGTATPVDPWTAATGGDHNGDGTVDAHDLAAQLNGMTAGATANDAGSGPSIAKLVEAAFAARDGNGDGLLSAKEFGDTGERLFRFLDLDQSGLASRGEVEKALSAQLDRARSLVPDLSEQAFAKRWLEALAGTRPTPNLGVLARVQQAFVRGDAAPTGLTSGILSARA